MPVTFPLPVAIKAVSKHSQMPSWRDKGTKTSLTEDQCFKCKCKKKSLSPLTEFPYFPYFQTFYWTVSCLQKSKSKHNCSSQTQVKEKEVTTSQKPTLTLLSLVAFFHPFLGSGHPWDSWVWVGHNIAESSLGYVNLTRAEIIWKEGTFPEKMPL